MTPRPAPRFDAFPTPRAGVRTFDIASATPWFVVTTSRGLEAACLSEIEELAHDLDLKFHTPPSPMAAGVRLQAGWDVCIALNLGLSTASRVLMPLASGFAHTLEDVYEVARHVRWNELFDLNRTFAVGASVASSPLTNNVMVALKVKDAIADVFRDACGDRPNVDTAHPDVRIAVRVLGPELEISINLSGEALTHHGYRRESTEAPLRESVAAGLLRYTGFADFARRLGEGVPVEYERPGVAGETHEAEAADQKKRRIPRSLPWSPVVCDPMCGSGTLVIEAALLLLQRKPCARREEFAFLALRKGPQLGSLAHRIRNQLLARERSVADVHALAIAYFEALGEPWEEGRPFLFGYDIDRTALVAAKAGAAAAGVSKLVEFQHRDATGVVPPAPRGLCIVNPPYGERLGSKETVGDLYSALGTRWKREFNGWMCWILSGNPEATKSVGLRPTRKVALFNGNLPCTFQQYIIY